MVSKSIGILTASLHVDDEELVAFAPPVDTGPGNPFGAYAAEDGDDGASRRRSSKSGSGGGGSGSSRKGSSSGSVKSRSGSGKARPSTAGRRRDDA